MSDPSTWPSASFKRTEWPRLSETLLHREPGRCNACGLPEARGAAAGVSGPPLLTTWQEHDRDDKPEPRYVVLCRPCGEKLIEPHPRLYAEMPSYAPAAGANLICLDCVHRDGCRCVCPDARANGGEGIVMSGPKPIDVHVQRAGSGGRGRRCSWEKWYPGPVTSCTGKEARP